MDGWLTASLTTVCVRHALHSNWTSQNKQYLRHSGKEFEGSSDRLPFIKCVVHRLQCLVSVFPFSCSCQSITTEWHKFSGTINVHALVTIRRFVIQLRWYVPGIGSFALNGPSWQEFKDDNVSVYLIKRKDSNLSCSSKYPPHLWTSIVYNISSDHFIILPIYLMLVRKVTDLLLNQGACVAFPAICYKLSAVLYSPGL